MMRRVRQLIRSEVPFPKDRSLGIVELDLRLAMTLGVWKGVAV